MALFNQLAFLGCISFLALNALLANAFYSKDGNVKLLNASEFKAQVVNSNDLHVVEFFANWCGHCKSFAPEYEKVAKALRGIVNVVAVEDEKAMGEFNVRGFPTIMVMAGKGGKTPKSFEYQGPRDAASVIEFAITHIGKLARARLSGKIDAGKDLPKGQDNNNNNTSTTTPKPRGGPSEVVELKDTNFDKLVFTNKDQVWFIEFYAPWCGHCKALAPQWEELAISLKGKVFVGKVDATTEQMIATRFSIRGFPTLKLFPTGDKSDSSAITYEGPRTVDDMSKFALDFFSATATAEQLLGDEMFKEACANQLCLISFLPHIFDSKTAKRNEYLDILNQVARASIHMPISFFWSQGGDQFDFEEQLQMAFGYPAVVAVHLSKEKYSIHRGDFSKESIGMFLQQLLSGKAPVSSIPSSGIKKLNNVTKWDGKDAAPIVEEEL